MESTAEPSHLDSLVFENRFTQELPVDADESNTPRQVSGACFSRVKPAVVAKPSLVAYAHEVADLIGLDRETCESNAFVEVFSGNRQQKGMDPYAMCYGGHQFGHWAGQLGDGRAINLGEVKHLDGTHWALQLKGAGPTPYSRTADGLAVLRSSVREFLCSEAMFHLGVPTTRALSLVLTGEGVVRDMFYDGHAKTEPGAIVCRVAPSFIRFGNFEILASRGEIDLLRQLTDFTIRNEFPQLGEPSVSTYLAWFREVCQRTAEMVTHWMRVGFVHGVMNTDNMSILGLTIDYGPYGWLENYDPNWTPNTTDAQGRRYRFGTQSQVALWNLVQLANAIVPLVDDIPALQAELDSYTESYEAGWRAMMAAKLGLRETSSDQDLPLFEGLQELLASIETDMTIFYRCLAELPLASTELDDATLIKHLQPAWYRSEELTDSYMAQIRAWIDAYKQILIASGIKDDVRKKGMNATNPKFVMRNYLAQEAIDKAEKGDFSGVHELLEVMRSPYAEQPGKEIFAARRPEWARNRAGCSTLSCSS